MVWEQRYKKADQNQGAEKGDQTPNTFGSLALFHTDLTYFPLLCFFCFVLSENGGRRSEDPGDQRHCRG